MRVDFRVYLITDRRQAPGEDIAKAVAGALDGGIRAVQLREKDLPAKDLYRLADGMRKLTAGYGARLLINDRVDVAMAVGADGVHLGGSSMPASAARKILGEEALIGCSTHSEAELREAERQGADFATFGPVYSTPSKAAYGPPVGVAALSGACGRSAIPVFALGGVKVENTGEAIGAGAFGIALISGIVAARDPRRAAMDLLTRVENALAIGEAAGGGSKGG